MSDEELQLDFNTLFEDEKKFYMKRKKGYAFSSFTLDLKGTPLDLSLRHLQSHALWGDRLYHSAVMLVNYIEAGKIDVSHLRVLELGAAVALPSIAALLYGAEKCVITDYPDKLLIENIQFNVDNCVPEEQRNHAVVQGFCWGKDCQPLIESNDNKKFDIIFCSDIICNHSEHEHILSICDSCLVPNGKAYITFTHHRPHLKEKDMEFFSLAKDKGFIVEHIETIKKTPMFPEDSGDIEIRSLVNLYSLTKV